MVDYLDYPTSMYRFIFLSNYLNTDIGLFFTTSMDGIPFSGSGQAGTNCELISNLDPNVCLMCQSNPKYYLFKHKCYPSDCLMTPVASFEVDDDGMYPYCYPCHHSCAACDNSKAYSRAKCNKFGDDFDCASGYQSNVIGCICDPGNVEYDENCSPGNNNIHTKCQTKYNVLDFDKVCKLQCPADSFLDFEYTSNSQSSITWQISGYDDAVQCRKDVYYLDFDAAYTGIKLPAPPDRDQLVYDEFSVSFWIYLDQPLTPAPTVTTTTLASMFDQVNIIHKHTAPQHITMIFTMVNKNLELVLSTTPAAYCSSAACLASNE